MYNLSIGLVVARINAHILLQVAIVNYRFAKRLSAGSAVAMMYVMGRVDQSFMLNRKELTDETWS